MSHLPNHSPNGHNNQGWAKLKPGAGKSTWISIWRGRTRVRHLFFETHQPRAGWETDKPVTRYVPVSVSVTVPWHPFLDLLFGGAVYPLHFNVNVLTFLASQPTGMLSYDFFLFRLPIISSC